MELTSILAAGISFEGIGNGNVGELLRIGGLILISLDIFTVFAGFQGNWENSNFSVLEHPSNNSLFT